MTTSIRRWPTAAVPTLVFLVALLAPVAGAAQSPEAGASSPGLTLDQVLELARQRNPRLHANRAAVQAAASREPGASTLPDPVLQVGAMNLALPELSDDMAASMAPSVQLMQMIPFPGKLGLRGEIAGRTTDMVEAGADETWWEIRSRAAEHFFDLYSADRRIEVLGSTLELLQDLEEVARAMYEAGTGRQADVLRAHVEIARIDGDLQRLEAMRMVAAARLNALLDRDADAPLPKPVLPPMPEALPPTDTLLAWAEETRPLLRGGRAGVERASDRLDLARKDIWPDLTVGVQYGQRDRGTGVERMGGVMLGVSLPIWAGRRQLRARDEAEAAGLEARARLSEARADVRGRIGVHGADLARARRLIELHRQEILPQARANVQSSLSSYRVGSVDFGTLVEAELLVNRHEAELFELIADYGKAVAGLEAAVGRPLPVTDDLLAEKP